MGISYDSVETSQKFADDKGISFLLLSDPQSKVIDQYGLRNEKASGRSDGVPHPTTYLIDQQGKIRARMDGTVMRRHSPEQLLEEIAGLAHGN